jgi:hypothetical protein
MLPAETKLVAARAAVTSPFVPLLGGTPSCRAEGVKGLPVIWRLLRDDGGEALLDFAEG